MFDKIKECLDAGYMLSVINGEIVIEKHHKRQLLTAKSRKALERDILKLYPDTYLCYSVKEKDCAHLNGIQESLVCDFQNHENDSVMGFWNLVKTKGKYGFEGAQHIRFFLSKITQIDPRELYSSHFNKYVPKIKQRIYIINEKEILRSRNDAPKLSGEWKKNPNLLEKTSEEIRNEIRSGRAQSCQNWANRQEAETRSNSASDYSKMKFDDIPF